MSFFAFQPLVLNGKNIEDYTACQIVMQIGKSLRFGYTICKLFVVDGEFGNDIDSGFPDVTHIFGSPSVVRLA